MNERREYSFRVRREDFFNRFRAGGRQREFTWSVLTCLTRLLPMPPPPRPQPPTRAPQTASLLGPHSPRLDLRPNITGWRHSGQLDCSPVSTESVRIPWKPSSRTQCMPA